MDEGVKRSEGQWEVRAIEGEVCGSWNVLLSGIVGARSQ